MFGARRKAINKYRNEIALIWLCAVGGVFGNISPFFYGVLAEQIVLTGTHVGYVAGAELLGMCLCSLAVSFFLIRWRLKVLLLIAASAASVCNLITPFAESFVELLVIRFLSGFMGSGLIYSIAFGLVTRQNNPDRLIALGLLVQVSLSSALLFSFPHIASSFNWRLIAYIVGAIYASTLLLLPLLPERIAPYVTCGLSWRINDSSISTIKLLSALFLFYISIGTTWPFVALIAKDSGLSDTIVGSGLGIGLLIGACGGLVVALLGMRYGRIGPLSISLLGMGISFVLFGDVLSSTMFFVAIAILCFFWDYGQPYLLAAIGDSDNSGRFSVLIPAVVGLGYSLGSTISGYLIPVIGLNYIAMSGVAFLVLSGSLLYSEYRSENGSSMGSLKYEA